MNTCCTVVIGHVDHGKTALVRALTGVETDRLPEERARGLSITPGFAHCPYPSGVIDFVDAPGHADFVQAMVSGATGAQAALIVISLVDGMGTQTIEHLSIAGLLGISKGVIAITKSDLIAPSEQAQRLSEIRDSLSQTDFAAAPMVICSAVSGDGIKALHEALENLFSLPTSYPPALRSFLPIDRAFSLPGRGTIVTGTLLGQDLRADSELVLQPAGHVVSFRSLQSRGAERAHIRVGERMAANLRGINANDISRGAVLCAGGIGKPSEVVDAHLNMLPEHAKNLKHMQELRVMFGTSGVVAQVRLFKDSDEASTFAQLRFNKPVVCFAGQRAILRRLSPPETIGGAVFLDPQAEPAPANDALRLAVLKAAQARDTAAVAKHLCAASGGVAKLSDISRLACFTPAVASEALGDTFMKLDADTVSVTHEIEAAKAAMLDTLAAFHKSYPLRLMAPRSTLEIPRYAPLLLQHVQDLAVAKGELRRHGNKVSLWAHDPVADLSQDQRKSMSDLKQAFRRAGLTSSSSSELFTQDRTAEFVQLLIDIGGLIALRNVALNQTLIFHTATVADAAHALDTHFPAQQPFTTSEARTALCTSRRVIVPLLEHFDSIGVTLRDKNRRHIVNLNLISQSV